MCHAHRLGKLKKSLILIPLRPPVLPYLTRDLHHRPSLPVTMPVSRVLFRDPIDLWSGSNAR